MFPELRCDLLYYIYGYDTCILLHVKIVFDGTYLITTVIQKTSDSSVLNFVVDKARSLFFSVQEGMHLHDTSIFTILIYKLHSI